MGPAVFGAGAKRGTDLFVGHKPRKRPAEKLALRSGEETFRRGVGQRDRAVPVDRHHRIDAVVDRDEEAITLARRCVEQAIGFGTLAIETAPKEIDAASEGDNGDEGGHGSSALESVAGAAHGNEPRRLTRLLFDLLAQPTDVDIDGTGVTGEIVTPDLVEKLVTGEGAPSVAKEKRQQLVLFGLERQRAAGAKRLAPSVIDGDVNDTDAPAISL